MSQGQVLGSPGRCWGQVGWDGMGECGGVTARPPPAGAGDVDPGPAAVPQGERGPVEAAVSAGGRHPPPDARQATGGPRWGPCRRPVSPSRMSVSHNSVHAGPGARELPFLSVSRSRSCPHCTVWDPGPRDVVSPLIHRVANIFLLFIDEDVGEGQPGREKEEQTGQGRRGRSPSC